MQIQISWLVKKPTDLDLHSLLRHVMTSHETLKRRPREVAFRYCGFSSVALLLMSVYIYIISLSLKGSIFFENRHFIIKERFNKLIYCIHTIIKWGIWQPIKFQLVSRSWNEMTFYRVSELMLPTLIQRYDKYHFISDPVQKRETNLNFTGSQMPHFMIVLILYINLFNLSWIKHVHSWGIWSL